MLSCWPWLPSLAAPFVAHGISVALVGYDLCPTIALGGIVDQVRAACAWLWRQAPALGHDPWRMFVGGHSAGAQLAAVTLATAWPALDRGLPRALLRGGVAVSGVYDLAPLRATSINDAVGLDAAGARQWSPVHMNPVAGASLLLAVGGAESAAFRRQTADLARAWHAVVTATLEVPGANHFTVLEALADEHARLHQLARRLITA